MLRKVTTPDAYSFFFNTYLFIYYLFLFVRKEMIDRQCALDGIRELYLVEGVFVFVCVCVCVWSTHNYSLYLITALYWNFTNRSMKHWNI